MSQNIHATPIVQDVLAACRAHLSQPHPDNPELSPYCLVKFRVLTDAEYKREQKAKRKAEAKAKADAQRAKRLLDQRFASVRAFFSSSRLEFAAGCQHCLVVMADSAVIAAMLPGGTSDSAGADAAHWVMRDGRPVGLRLRTSLGVLGLAFDCEGAQSHLTMASWKDAGYAQVLFIERTINGCQIVSLASLPLPEDTDDNIVLPAESEQDRGLSRKERMEKMMDIYWERHPNAKEHWTYTWEWPEGADKPLQPWPVG